MFKFIVNTTSVLMDVIMRRYLFFIAILLSYPAILFAQKVVEISIDETINPVSAAYVSKGIEYASKERAECLLIQLNTPGGLLKSTRVIVSAILESPVPVVVYVSPGGAHAGSAGVFITLSAHIAAMAPGTNIGAAHPINIQGPMDSVMNNKATNDAAAFIRSIAEKRKRNLEWADEAVRKSISITENEALNKSVIDVVANNTTDLLRKIDGKKIETSAGVKILHTRAARIEPLTMSTTEKILNLLSDPNIAYILLLLGMYGILFELYNPGAILPGIIGVICLILSFYTMHSLPINYAGLALIIFAIILFLLEIKIVSHGMLAIGGAISLILGSMMLIRSDSSLELVKISRGVIVSSTAITTLFFLFVIGVGLRAQRAKPVTGIEGLIGEVGLSLETLDPRGLVRMHGEIWKAESISGKIDKDSKVRVVAMEHMNLKVESLLNG
ncbi:NfeD family protein [Solitalea lacus]|uniref:NfeD family protein n=1 Tax=Solitalea lacus TaxID=2911172 RepID=UPI001EDB5DF3|nr:nodulation protein NfeD [Solitalea lacus]UKJ07209.1 nodulation protein NfeD [Solitalea lacus]